VNPRPARSGPSLGGEYLRFVEDRVTVRAACVGNAALAHAIVQVEAHPEEIDPSRAEDENVA
jgi:hypothetical protein